MDKRILPNQIVLYTQNLSKRYGEVIEKNHSKVKIRELLKPEDLSGKSQTDNRQPYSGTRELYRTSKFSEQPIQNIIEVFPIIPLSDYQSSTGFILRQHYDISTNFLYPDLPKVCICNSYLNPDFSFFICGTCLKIFHNSCVSLNMCPDCTLPMKRQHPASDDQVSIKKTARQDMNFPLDIEKYKSLSEASKSLLTDQVNTLHLTYQSNQSTLLPEEKIRKQIICKIQAALLLAHEEVRSQEPINVSMNHIEKIATSIESEIFCLYNQNVKSSEYSKKIRALLFNLTAEKNQDFRGGVLREEIKPNDICQMQSKDMASSEIKSFRSERQKVYTKEQLILPENAKKLLMKSRKGEFVINVNERLESEISQEMNELLYKKDPEKFEIKSELAEIGKFKKDTQLKELIKEWTVDSVILKMKEKFSQYLPSDQCLRLFTRIDAISIIKK